MIIKRLETIAMVPDPREDVRTGMDARRKFDSDDTLSIVFEGDIVLLKALASGRVTVVPWSNCAYAVPASTAPGLLAPTTLIEPIKNTAPRGRR